MGSPAVLNLEQLLAPVAGDKPTGVNLRQDYSPTSVYHMIKDARSKSRAIERSAIVDDTGKAPIADWKPILNAAPKVIAEKSKDLEVVAWLIESLVREKGFAGLRDGFQLVKGLVEQYWDGLYPEPDEEGISTRLAPLVGLNGDDSEGTLINPINNIPLVGNNGTEYSRSSYRQASDVEGITDLEKREARIRRGAVTVAMFQSAVDATPGEVVRETMADLTECIDAYEQMVGVVSEKAGDKAPGTSQIRNALEACKEILESTARDKLAPPMSAESTEQTSGDGDGAAATTSTGAGMSSGPIRNRGEAFEQLLKIAKFFRDTEPQSPVSYALEQVVRWGRMPLPALLSELIPDDAPRTQLFKMVGLSAEPKEG